MRTDIVNFLILAVFLGLLLVSTLSTAARGIRYRRASHPLPRLWGRDIALIGGLTIPFVLIFAARAFSFAPSVAGQLWWSLITGIPPIVGIAVYAYFELFVIEAQKDR